MKNRDIYWRRYKIQETLCMGQWHLSSLQSRHLGTHTVLPITISYPIIFSWISLTVWNLFPFKGDFSFGKSQKSQGAKYGLYGGWVTWMIWCFLKNLFTRCDAWASVLLSWWSWQSPVAHSCSLLNHLESFWGEMFKLNANLKQIHCSTDSFILNVMATQYTCSLNGIYHPHWLLQWSHHCSCRFIPVHYPWLPGYINITQTILIKLTMAGLLLDTPCIVQSLGFSFKL